MANTCIQALKGIAQDCESSQGGVMEVYIANKEDVDTITELEGKISEITMKLEAKFKVYKFNPETAGMTSTYTIDSKTNVRFCKTDLVLSFNRMETVKRIEINALIKADSVVIVKDNNKKYFLLGKDEPVMATAADGGTGTARGDKNGYGITLTDNSLEYPYEVNPEIIPALLDAIPA